MRTFYDVAVDGVDGIVEMDIPDNGQPELDDSTVSLLVNPLCTLCGNFSHDARGLFFSPNSGVCNVGAREEFIQGIHVKSMEQTKEKDDFWREEVKTGVLYFRVKGKCSKFKQRI